MIETLAGVSPSNIEDLHEEPSLADAAPEFGHPGYVRWTAGL